MALLGIILLVLCFVLLLAVVLKPTKTKEKRNGK
jgi:hypothetical protein